jgi:hypothetical protein
LQRICAFNAAIGRRAFLLGRPFLGRAQRKTALPPLPLQTRIPAVLVALVVGLPSAAIEGTHSGKRRVVNMSQRPGFVARLWNSLKDQIVQPVPQEIQFCEFSCKRKQCSLEVSGWCEIRPRPALFLIKSAPGTAHPQWPRRPAAGAPENPAHVA